MIGIQFDGDEDFLDTLPNTSINLKLENPILGSSDKLSPGSYSLPFEIPTGPTSEKNESKLRHPGVIENNQAYVIQKAKLFFDGILFKEGNLKAKSNSSRSISSHFLFGLSQISPDFKVAKLRDILNQNILISATSRTKEVYIKKLNGSSEAKIEINGQIYTDTLLIGFQNQINGYYNANAIMDNPDSWFPRSEMELTDPTPMGEPASYIRLRIGRTIEFIGFPTVIYATDPHIPLHIRLEEDQKVNWRIEAFDMTDYYQDFSTFLEDYWSGDYPNDLIRWPLMYNANLHPDGFKDELVINGKRNSGLRKNNPNYGLTVGIGMFPYNDNSLQPFLLLKGVLNKIAETFDFEYEGDFYEDPDTATRLLDHSLTLDLPMYFLGDKKFIFWRRSFNVNELVPDVSVVDFFKNLSARYNISVYYSEVTKKVRMSYREQIARSNDYEDITPISSPIKIIDDVRITGFTIKVPKDETDAWSTDEKMTVGTPEDEYEIKIGRLFSTLTQVIDGKNLTGPYKSQPHSDKFSMRIFHYKGINETGSYNHAEAALHGVDINEGLDSFFNGLFIKLFQYWLHFQKNRLSVELNCTFPLRKLLHFDWEKKYRFDRTNYLIKSIDVKITNKGLSVSDVELYTMK